MVIRRLELRNWGPYTGDHTLVFDRPDPDRTIQLIRGENGHGKTHLLRAMVIALQGKDGMRIVDPSSRVRGSSTQKHLDGFLADALSIGAEAAEEPQMSLAIELEDGEEKIRVERSWWYDERTPADEELTVLLDGVPYEPHSRDRYEQYAEKQALIRARIPENVMQFFFFDGEEIKTIAESDPGEEVTAGLDALLGLTLLRELNKDVDNARSALAKEEVAGKRAISEIQRLESEITGLEASEVEVADKLVEERSAAAAIEAELDDLQQQLPFGADVSEAGAGHKADIATRMQTVQRDRDNVRRRIGEIVAGDLAILYPTALVERTIERLNGERSLRDWEHQRELMAPECAKLSERMYGSNAPESDPPLSGSQRRFYRDLLVQEWKNILQPPPSGIPDDEWLQSLSGEHLEAASGRLQAGSNAPSGDIASSIREDAALGEQLRALSDRLDNYASDQESRLTVEKIRDSSDRLGQIKRAVTDLEGQQRELGAELAEKRRDHSTKVAQAADSDETREKLIVARDIIDVITKFRDQLKKRRVEDLQTHIQQMMAKLAHKGTDQFHTVTIDPNSFHLSIFDKDGNEVRRLSAGEREILALSMLWALGKISRRRLPIVIDTPLGRLDSRHRENIVEFFLPAAADQVIVLATDEEITEARQVTLASRLAGSMELVFDRKHRTTSVRSVEEVAS
jgi:DNA sulfur modification protein DndD